MRSETIQIRQRGTLTLPTKLRAKYRLDAGDSLTIVDLDGSILLAPKLPVVPKLAAEVERLRRATGLSIADLLPTRPASRDPRTRTARRK